MRRSTRILAAAAAAVGLMALPQVAAAGEKAAGVLEVGTVEGVVAAATVIGDEARTTFSRVGTSFIITDPGGVTALSGCVAVTATRVSCPAEGLTSVQFTGRGPGNDLVVARAGLGVRAVLVGGLGNDRLTSGGGGDDLWGGGGSDILTGNAGADLFYGGPGMDTIRGGLGNDRLHGGPGNDVLDESTAAGGGGRDTFWGDAGNDTIRAKGDATWAERIYGGDGTDTASRDSWDSYWSVERVF